MVGISIFGAVSVCFEVCYVLKVVVIAEDEGSRRMEKSRAWIGEGRKCRHSSRRGKLHRGNSADGD